MRHSARAARVVAAAALAGALAATASGLSSAASEEEAPASVTSDVAIEPPALDEPIPRGPIRLSRRLRAADGALRREIDAWRRNGDPTRGQPPEAVGRWALYEQRVTRLLARRPRLHRATARRLGRAQRAVLRDGVQAFRSLAALSPPVERRRLRRLRTADPLPVGVLLDHYRAAERRFGVDWHLLAAVHMVETQFGRLRSRSTAGARGPMQFMPATWRAYGMGGDVHDTRDAIMGAANYLRASGAPRGDRRALYAYNHSWRYVDAVLRWSRRMARSPRRFLIYHSWQVFVRTRGGEVRLTAPAGARR